MKNRNGSRLHFASPARAEQVVVSSNTVGYEKITLNYGLNMVGVNFTIVGAQNGGAKLSQVVPDSNATGVDWEGDWSRGTTLMIWNGSDYVGGRYYWTGEVPDWAQEEQKEELGLDDTYVYNNIWVDNNWMPVDPDLVIGNAFWIQDSAQALGATKCKVTIAGEVANPTNVPNVSLYSGLSMVGNQYPTAITLADIKPINATGVDWEGDWSRGTTLMIWNGSDYVGGRYYWTGEVPDWAQEEQKEELGLDDTFVYNNIWVDNNWMPANAVSIPIGGAFWFQDANVDASSTISFTAPQ